MLVSEHQRVAILPILVLSTVIATGAAGNTGGEPTCDEPGCEYDVTDWLRPSTTQDIPLARFGRMKMKWQTPIYRVNSKGFLKMPTLHAELSSEVMKHYNGILQRNQLSLDASSHGVNQVFFEWQLRGGWEQFFAQRCGCRGAAEDCGLSYRQPRREAAAQIFPLGDRPLSGCSRTI
eukprot:m.266307 g.266307  ORF g.266307 m.266307 type:complete len:177 (+) comp19274_c0_seq9:196-726(+)